MVKVAYLFVAVCTSTAIAIMPCILPKNYFLQKVTIWIPVNKDVVPVRSAGSRRKSEMSQKDTHYLPEYMKKAQKYWKNPAEFV